MSYKVEYLAIIEAKEEFCNNVEAFNSLLHAFGSIKTSTDKIAYSGSEFEYSVQRGVVAEGEQVYFHMRFNCFHDESLEDYKKLLRLVRTILQKVCLKAPEVLWDDMSASLCLKAYPLIYELENMMRKLITKFMLISIGASWASSAVPREVSESVKIKKSAPHSYLYDADFIQLSNFLFKKYSTANSDKLFAKLDKAKGIQDINFSELKEMIPKSNWERYFSPIVDCNSDYLDSRWKRLYDLRCIVAHNNFLTSENYDEVLRLSLEVKEKLEKAILNIDRIHVSEEQKEEVAESVVSGASEYVSTFLQIWNSLLDNLYMLFDLTGLEVKTATGLLKPAPMLCARMLLLSNVIDQKIHDEFDDITAFRNTLVHSQFPTEEYQYVELYTQFAEDLDREIRNLITARL